MTVSPPDSVSVVVVDFRSIVVSPPDSVSVVVVDIDSPALHVFFSPILCFSSTGGAEPVPASGQLWPVAG